MSHKHRNASIDDHTLDQLVDMAVESVGGDPSNSDFTPALKKARDKWEDAVERELTKWVSKNIDKFDLDARSFYNLGDDADVDDIVEVLLELRGGAGYLYFMEMEGHGVGTWDGDWDELFVDGSRGVKELSDHMARVVSREYRDLKNEIEDIAMGSIPEDEDGYEDDRYADNRYANRRPIKHRKSTMSSRSVAASDRKRLIKLASTMPVGSPERKAILAGLTSMQEMLEEEGMMDKMSRKPWGSLGISPSSEQPWGKRESQTDVYRELYNKEYYDEVTSKKAQKSRRASATLRTRKFARAKLTDFEKVHIKAMLDHLDRVERLIERVTLNDASDALNDMEKVESAVDQFEGQGYTIHDDLYFWNDIPTDIEDSAFNMQQAVEEAIHDIKQMIDDGMADGGYEDEVMEQMENEVMPRIEDAIADHRHLLKSYR